MISLFHMLAISITQWISFPLLLLLISALSGVIFSAVYLLREFPDYWSTIARFSSNESVTANCPHFLLQVKHAIMHWLHSYVSCIFQSFYVVLLLYSQVHARTSLYVATCVYCIMQEYYSYTLSKKKRDFNYWDSGEQLGQ